ncbi:MAG: MFS transporter, partial [Pseudomonadota bacterium]
KTPNEARGKVLASYRIVDLGATMAGQGLLAVASPEGFILFAIISILISLSLVPVALTKSSAPQPIAEAKLDLKKLAAVSPLAAFGSLAVGAANSAFWSVGPVYVQEVGYAVSAVAIFISAVVLGGAVAQWPLGVLSDKMDRRYVIIAVSGLAAVAAVGLATFGGLSFSTLIAGGVAFGLFAMPLFGLCIAHANDRAEPDEYLETNGGLFLLYGVGSVFFR